MAIDMTTMHTISEQFVDQAKTLRDSDAFDLQAVHDWLNAQGLDYGQQQPQIK